MLATKTVQFLLAKPFISFIKLSDRFTSVASITIEESRKIFSGFIPALRFNSKLESLNLDDFPLLISFALLEFEVRMKAGAFFSVTADPRAHPHAPPPMTTILLITNFYIHLVNL